MARERGEVRQLSLIVREEFRHLSKFLFGSLHAGANPAAVAV